jgi:eukaryotic-like serine/threonine-protein kinase
MSFTPQNMCGFLIRSGLMTPDDMHAMFQLWLTEAKNGADDSSQFTRWLAARQYVTEYQASLLAKGHGDPDSYFLNQYKIMDRLGRGRMAGVYRAVHALGQTVAIKVLPPSKAKDPLILGRFQREARLALRLKHPNVVRAFQIGQANGLHYLVMEYLEGETLDDVLQRRKRLPPAEAVRLIHQALMGLEHIHEQGMVHRDLKPANLMLVSAPRRDHDADTTLQATLKILDIGLGRTMFEEEAPPGEEKVELTGEGMILGTPDYLAPEQARDPRAIDIRADIYSLGCVLYQLLSGRPPFPDANLINQMVRHATEIPTPLQQYNPEIPDGLQQIVSYMIAKQPAQRYSNPERAAQALQIFLIAESRQPRPAEEAPQMRSYLTWLEATPPEPATGSAAAKGSPGSGAEVPIAQPVAQTPKLAKPTPIPRASPTVPALPRPSSRNSNNNRPRGAKVPIAKPAPAAAAQEFDVELVPVAGEPSTPTANPEQKTFGLTRHEWWLVAAVAGVVLGIVLFGVLIVWLSNQIVT